MNEMSKWWNAPPGTISPPGCSPAPDCGTPCPPMPPCPPFPPTPPPWFSPPTPPWYPGANAGVSFGQTFPPNPCRGHFLWDGTTLWMFDGVVWVEVGGSGAYGIAEAPADGKLYGRESAAWVVVPPSIPDAPLNGQLFGRQNGGWMQVVDVAAATQFSIVNTASATVGTGPTSWTAVPLTATPAIDVQGAWNAATLRFTPTKAGLYAFSARAFSGAGASIAVAVVKNDPGTFGDAATDTVIATSVATVGWCQCSGHTQMNGSGDYVRLFAYQTNGLFAASGPNPVLSAALFP